MVLVNGHVAPQQLRQEGITTSRNSRGVSCLFINPSLCLSFLVGSCNPAGLMTADPSLAPVSTKRTCQQLGSLFHLIPFFSLWDESFLKHSAENSHCPLKGSRHHVQPLCCKSSPAPFSSSLSPGLLCVSGVR